MLLQRLLDGLLVMYDFTSCYTCLIHINHFCHWAGMRHVIASTVNCVYHNAQNWNIWMRFFVGDPCEADISLSMFRWHYW